VISQREVGQYRETGYLVVADVLDAGQLSALRQSLDNLVAGAGGLTDHTDIYDLEPDHRPDTPRVRRVKSPHLHTPLFWDICRTPKLVAILEKLLGPSGVRLHGSKINLKAPHYGSPVEWHQDWAFYPHTNDDLLAVGVMLDDAFLENGPLLVMPGSHKGPVFDHHSPDGFFCGALDPTLAGMDFDKAVPLTGRAGSMSFHHVRMVHGSAQNVSDKPRRLLLYEYAAGDASPLLGIKDFAAFNRHLIAGQPSSMPRMEHVPVRMPLPPAPRQGSIYENQTTAQNRYFGRQPQKA
jgi:phytanoyl-CoA hydroxylase